MEVYKDIILMFLILICLYFGYKIGTKRIIMSTSKRYHAIDEINQSYEFHIIDDTYTYKDRLKSKNQFDRYNYHRKLKNYIADNKPEIEALANKILENKVLWIKYQEQIDNIPPYMDKETIKGNVLPFFLYRYHEKKLCTKHTLIEPKTNPKIIHKIRYTSPKGRNDYQDKKIWDYNDIHTIMESIRLEDKRKQSKEYQRSLVTPGVRYDVLQRDNFTCVLCNTSSKQGVQLEVDHIKPVSKGGLSTMDNLRTLCRPCNRGKSDKYDPNGVN